MKGVSPITRQVNGIKNSLLFLSYLQQQQKTYLVFCIQIFCVLYSVLCIQGKLNLVDLAGSERQSKTEATGDRLKEVRGDSSHFDLFAVL